jgi:3-oxoacyl-[acyl-carrier-protein] synthase-1
LDPQYITRYSIACSAGVGSEAMLQALRSQGSGLTRCDFESAVLDAWIGRVPEKFLLPPAAGLEKFDCRNNRLAALGLATDGFGNAVVEASQRYGRDRIGVFMGTSTSGILQTELAYRRRAPDGTLPSGFLYPTTHNSYSLAWFVQAALGLEGPAVVISTACSSSAKAFGSAARMIAAGACDAAVVGGVDSLCLTTLYGFGSLGLLSPEPCRPFDAQRSGISIGEGAAFALLERAGRPGALRLLGVGESSDAYHMSSPHPEGLGAQLAMRDALRSAGLAATDIDYINLHGTGTQSNDETEALAVHALFGDRVPCSSTKGWTGHTLGACGAIEAIICALALRGGFLPGSANTRTVDPAIPLRYLVENEPADAGIVMSNAFGFGGTNCSLVLAR